ncbi:hypothetical protein V6Z12_A06G013900 [Gossypium hirsutum]
MLSTPFFISSSFLQLGFQHPSSPVVHRAERRGERPRGRSGDVRRMDEKGMRGVWWW